MPVYDVKISLSNRSLLEFETTGPDNLLTALKSGEWKEDVYRSSVKIENWEHVVCIIMNEKQSNY
jgi:hypothetical protein